MSGTNWRAIAPEELERRVMDELHEVPGSVPELADVMGLSKEAVRRVVMSLEAKGLVEVERVIPKVGSCQAYAIYRAARTKKGLTIEQSKDMFALHKWARLSHAS